MNDYGGGQGIGGISHLKNNRNWAADTQRNIIGVTFDVRKKRKRLSVVASCVTGVWSWIERGLFLVPKTSITR